MGNSKEKELLMVACKENDQKFGLISDLLEIQRNKSLMNKKRGLSDEIEAKVDTYLKIRRNENQGN